MKRTFIYVFILAVLLGLVYFLSRENTDQLTSSQRWDRNFAVKDTDQIGTIFIAPRDSEPVKLTREGDRWLVNDKYLANKSAMESMLTVLRDVDVKYVPPRASYSTIIQSIAGLGIKVEIYDRRDNLMKAYYIGGVPQDERGNFFIMEDADQPYVVHLPYFVGNLRARFTLSEEQWRDRAIFSERTSEIKKISVRYPSQEDESFIVERNNDGRFDLRPLDEKMPKILRQRHPGMLDNFVRNFQRIGVESFANDLIGKDSILNTTPFAVVELERTDGEIKSYNFYQRFPAPLIGPYAARQASQEEFILRFYVSNNNTGDFMSGQYGVLQRALWGYSWFFRASDT